MTTTQVQFDYSLPNMVANCNFNVDKIDFTKTIDLFQFPEECRNDLDNECCVYYKAISALCSFLSNQKGSKVKFCDLGTWKGQSALAAYHGGAEVDTFDITTDNMYNLGKIEELCNFTLLKEPKDCLDIDYSQYDLVFCDVSAEEGYGAGEMEELIHGKLIESNFNGIALYDDICLDPYMIYWWNKVEQPKLFMLYWHMFASHDMSIMPGFGVIDYRKN
jgi:hypothetical protein